MNNRPIVKGDRFLDRDVKRKKDRVVEVDEVNPHHYSRGHWTPIRVRVEVHPLNPSAVGRSYWISHAVLRGRFTRISQ